MPFRYIGDQRHTPPGDANTSSAANTSGAANTSSAASGGVPQPPCEEQPKVKRKKCTACGKVQDRTEFAKHSTSSDGHASICDTCRNKRNDDRRRTNPDARLKHLISTRALKQFPDYPRLTEDLEDYLGYSIKRLRTKLDRQCKRDFGKTMLQCTESGDYHIDHVKPLSSFKCESPDSLEFRKCWAVDNLVMITAEENLRKGATIVDAGGSDE